jgi:acetolactate synthase-1/2/3 large subunit
MRDLVHDYLARRVSRRGFVRRLAAAGFSVAAAGSILDSLEPLAHGEEAPVPFDPASATRVEGNGGKLLVEQLRAAGVRFVFNCNSTRTHPIFDALVEDPDIQVIQVPQEGQMISIAQGYALASNEIAFTVNGSVGFPNTLNNMYNAWKDRTPMVIVSQREPTPVQGGRDAFEDWDDYLAPSASFTRWRWNVDRADRIPEILRRAFKIAATPPEGPVALAIPADVLDAGGARAVVVPRDRFILQPRIKPDPARITEAAEFLVGARHPLLIVGPEVSRAGANREIVRLAECLSIPVCQGERLRDDFPTDHPLFLGHYTTPLQKPAEHDVILNIGSRMPYQESMIHPHARIIHASLDADSIGRVTPTDVGLVADVRETAIDLAAAIESVATGIRLAETRETRLAAVREQTDRRRGHRVREADAAWNLNPLSWLRVGGELEKRLEPDAIIVPELIQTGWMGFADNAALGLISFAPGGKSKIGRTTGAALGWGVGAALGVKLAQPDRQVVALQGDGGFLFAQAETLWTMARYEVPVIIIILNNRSYEGPRQRILRGPGRQAETGKDMTCYLGDPDVDFAKVAAGFGVKGELVETPDQLGPALDRAIRATRDGRPYLIDALVGRVGPGADSVWHPAYSVAAARTRPV